MSAWDEVSRLRAAVMRAGLDFGRLSGLEVGALSHPMTRRSEGDVTYVDHTDTESLRRTYAADPNVNAADLVEVDAVWGERTLLECLGGRRVDYIMASHVAEHVPDLVTWLDEARSVLNPGGQLRLALPDKRFSNDALRQETRLSDLLTAWLLKARRPQVRDVVDFRLLTAAGVDGRGVYDGRVDVATLLPAHPFDVAVESARWARDDPDTYFDVHCLVVQAGTFARLMEELGSRGVLRMACADMIDTAPPLFEFYVFLTPCDDPEAVTRSWREVRSRLHDPLPGSAAAACVARQTAEQARLAALDQALIAAEAARAQAESRLARMQRSWSWRMTAPLRRVRGLLPAPAG